MSTPMIDLNVLERGIGVRSPLDTLVGVVPGREEPGDLRALAGGLALHAEHVAPRVFDVFPACSATYW